MAIGRSVFWFVVLAAVLAFLVFISWPVVRYRYTVSDSYLYLLTIGRNATHYGPRYSDSALTKVRIGMSREEVQGILGEPLRRYSYVETNECWRYSLPASQSGHYHNRSVSFSLDGRVIDVYKGFYFD